MPQMEYKYLTNVSRNVDTVLGRAEKLKEIHERLHKYAPVVLVNGLGGIGKTTVALEFIRCYEQDYKYIAWIEVTDTIISAFVSNATLIDRLGLTDKPGPLPRSIRSPSLRSDHQ
ncbi:MAG: ATP-binding protein [Saprospiraceae bacterium]|nr:ATP-binding protein [Saprospiraceae bacterium]